MRFWLICKCLVILNVLLIATLSSTQAASVAELKRNSKALSGSPKEFGDRILYILKHQKSSTINKTEKKTAKLKSVSRFLVGQVGAYQYNWTAKYPVLIVPGVLSSDLQVWYTDERLASKQVQACARRYFRKRLFADLNNVNMILFAKKCYINLIKLDINTGMDSNGTRVRAADGEPSGVSPAKWMFGSLYENLAVLGYTNRNLQFASYDWRLVPQDLEKRDRFFSGLQLKIEQLYTENGEQVAVLSHSMGCLMVLYFLKFMQNSKHVDGVAWIDKHIKYWLPLSPPFLGAPSSVSHILSGDPVSKAVEYTIEARVTDFFSELALPRADRLTLLRSWSSIAYLLPRGGNEIWGNSHGQSMDSKPANNGSMGYLVQISFANGTTSKLTTDDVMRLLENTGGSRVRDVIDNLVDWRYLKTAEDLEQVARNPASWSNPLACALPPLKSMKVISMVGVNSPTIRTAFYNYQPVAANRTTSDNWFFREFHEVYEKLQFWQASKDTDYRLDRSLSNSTEDIAGGYMFADGDSIVNLLSLNYVQTHIWNKHGPHNPNDVIVLSREYYNHPRNTKIKWNTGATHEGVLSNDFLIFDVLRLVSGEQDKCTYESNEQVPIIRPSIRSGASHRTSFARKTSTAFLPNRFKSSSSPFDFEEECLVNVRFSNIDTF